MERDERGDMEKWDGEWGKIWRSRMESGARRGIERKERYRK